MLTLPNPQTYLYKEKNRGNHHSNMANKLNKYIKPCPICNTKDNMVFQIVPKLKAICRGTTTNPHRTPFAQYVVRPSDSITVDNGIEIASPMAGEVLPPVSSQYH